MSKLTIMAVRLWYSMCIVLKVKKVLYNFSEIKYNAFINLKTERK